MSSVPKSARRNAFILESEIGGLKEEPHEEQSVETMALEKQSNHNSLSNDIINAFKEVFDLFDSNGGGTIDADELDLALRSVDIQLSQEEIVDVLTSMDKDGNGEIDFEEFLNLMTNTERFLEGFDHDQNERNQPEIMARRERRETRLFEALTNFMKRSALHSINEIVGFYHTKYKRIQAPHVVGHYIAGARLIGLTEGQLRKHIDALKARHAEGDEKSPYAEPLHIVFGNVSKKKRSRRVRTKKDASPICRGKIRLRFTSFSAANKDTNITNSDPVKSVPAAMNPVRTSRPTQAKKRLIETMPNATSWQLQRIKPFSVQLPFISSPTNDTKDIGISVDHLPDIRNKVEKAKECYYERVFDRKKKESENHWKALKSKDIKSDTLRSKFRIAFNAYTSYLHIDDSHSDGQHKVVENQRRSKSVLEKRHSVAVPSPFRKRAHSTFQ